MLNKCMFIGHLGRDPEVRTMQNGQKVANLSLGITEKWKSKDGERKERTEWARVVIFGHLAEVAEKYAKKGSKVYVCGSMQTRKWTDKDGAEKYTTEVVLQGYNSELVLLDGKTGAAVDGPVDAPMPGSREARDAEMMDDDIPF